MKKPRKLCDILNSESDSDAEDIVAIQPTLVEENQSNHARKTKRRRLDSYSDSDDDEVHTSAVIASVPVVSIPDVSTDSCILRLSEATSKLGSPTVAADLEIEKDRAEKEVEEEEEQEDSQSPFCLPGMIALILLN